MSNLIRHAAIVSVSVLCWITVASAQDATPLPDEPTPVPVAPGIDSPAPPPAPPAPPPVVESVVPTSEAAPATTTETTVFALQVIAGLIVLLVLTYLGGHHRVLQLQERLGIGGVVTAGFPFVALGVVASLPQVGILTGDVLDGVRPLLHFGLGWLGFIVGAQLDIRVLDRVPRGTAYLVLVETLGPFLVTAAACGAVMLAFGLSWRDPDVWRDVIILGAAAAMTAPRTIRGIASRDWREGKSGDLLLAQLDELAGVIGLIFITAYFRDPTATAWALPSTAWVFVSLGLGVAIGVLIIAMVRVPRSNAEFLAVVLGGIAFASGFAGYLRLSPIVICFVAGVLVANLPNDRRDNLFPILRHLERPVYLLFLTVAGAVWDVSDWRGWVLVPLFAIARIAGKWFGVLASTAVVAAQMPARFTEGRTIVAPLSGLSIAIVVGIEGLRDDRGLTWIVTAVIGGSIITELLVPVLTKRDSQAQRGPIDDLDDGPIYREDP